MFLTVDKNGVTKEYTHDEFFRAFDLRSVYFSSLYNEETGAISDLHVDFLAKWYGFDPQLLLKFDSEQRYRELDNIGVKGLLWFGKIIIGEGWCQEYSCGEESISYGDIIYLYSEKYGFKAEIRSINAFDIVPAHTAGLFSDLEEKTGLKIYVRT